jgi:hypothetical protein
MDKTEAENKAKAQEILTIQRSGAFHLPDLIGSISSLREKQILVTQIKQLLFREDRVSKLSDDLEKMRRALLSKFMTTFRTNLTNSKKILDSKSLSATAFAGSQGIENFRDAIRDIQTHSEIKALIPTLVKEYGLNMDSVEGKTCQRTLTFFREYQEVAKWRQSYQDLLDQNSTQKLSLVIGSLRRFEELVSRIDAENHKKCLAEVTELYQEIVDRLSQASQIEAEIRSDLAQVKVDRSAGFEFIERCFQSIQRTTRIDCGDPTAVSTFRIYLQHQLLKVVVAQANSQLQQPIQFFQGKHKLQLQLRYAHGNSHLLCLHPNIQEIREIWYRKIQEMSGHISDACRGFDTSGTLQKKT